MYQSTILGTSVRPFAPPNAVPRQLRPVTSWKGRVEISLPASATTMMLVPQPRWQASSAWRSEEHTSELQSLMRISYAVFCLKKKNHTNTKHTKLICNKYPQAKINSAN